MTITAEVKVMEARSRVERSIPLVGCVDGCCELDADPLCPECLKLVDDYVAAIKQREAGA